MIYLDSAASYPVLPEVQSALAESFADYANASSSHKLGSVEAGKVEETRALIADKLEALPSEIVFTSGATESNNLAIKGCVFDAGKPLSEVHLITSQAEHKCVLNIFSYLQELGCNVTFIAPNSSGVITPDLLIEALRPNTLLVSLMHVNNELGVINPIEELSKTCFERGIKFHTDAAQSFGKIPISVLDVEADFISLTAHKIGGPKGVGALYVKDIRSSKIVPVIHGAGQEEGLRGGTLPSPLINAFGRAIERFPHYYTETMESLESVLLDEFDKLGIQYDLNGKGTNRVKHISSVTLPSVNPVILMREIEEDVCLAQGSACSSHEVEPSHVLAAIGLGRDLASKTFRISYSHETTEEDVKSVARRIRDLISESD